MSQPRSATSGQFPPEVTTRALGVGVRETLAIPRRSVSRVAVHKLRTLVSHLVRPRRFKAIRGGTVMIGRDVDGLQHAVFEGDNAVGRGTFVGGPFVHVGRATTIGINCYLHGPIKLGKYCQLGPAVAIYGRDHATSAITSYVNRRLFDGRLKASTKDAPVTVGHDVWIGHGAILLKGVAVGNGAVIGAGAVVTKDVPSYAIAVGNPARVIRMRFDKEIVELLEQLSWWDLPKNEIARLEEVFHLDLALEPDRARALLHTALAWRRAHMTL